MLNKHSQEQKESTWVNTTARIGFIAKGIIYFSIGLLAIQIALGIGGETTNATNLLKQVIGQPFGYALLILCLIGLLAHAAWKGINGFLDIENRGRNLSGLIMRSVEVVIGVLYLSLSYAAFQILLGQSTQDSDQSTKIWIAHILTLPYGKWIVFAIAAVVVILGAYQFYYAYTEGFKYRFDFNRMSTKAEDVVLLMGRIGIGAWGVVYFMMSFLFYQAGVQANPDQVGGLDKAMSALAQQPYGAWVLGITAAGLMIYGIYLFLLSYFHKKYSLTD